MIFDKNLKSNISHGTSGSLSFLAVITACARGQQQIFTEILLKSMDKCRIGKTKEIYTAAMGAANDNWGGEPLKEGRHWESGWQWSLALLSEMASSKLEVDAVALGVALSVCLRARCWEVALVLATLVSN